MKRINAILLAIILLAQYASAQPVEGNQSEAVNRPEYTLEDFYKIALECAERIKISEEGLFIAERGKDKALSVLLPKLSAFGDYTKYSEEKKSSSSTGSFTIQPGYSSSWGFRLDQSLSLGGREITAYKISKKSIQSSEYDLQTTKEEYLFNVAASFFDVLKASKAVEIAKANVERLVKYRDEARARVKVGEATKTVLLRAEAELSGAQSELVRAENILILSKAVLARLVGISGEYEIKESGDKRKDDLDYSKRPLSSFIEKAFAERTELKSNDIQKKIAEEQVKYAKGAYLPTISVEGVYLGRDEKPASSFFNKESIYGILSLNFPIFEGGLRRAEVREAEAKKRQSELFYDDFKKTISIEVESAYIDLKTQAEILKSLEDQLTFAGDNYNAISKQFAFGLASSLDVMDANTLLVESERELSRAKYNYQLSLIRLKRSTGTLLKTVMSQ